MDKILEATRLFLGKHKTSGNRVPETQLEDASSGKTEHSVNDIQSEVKNNKRSELKNKGKLFVGGLNYATTSEDLQAYFSQFGRVMDAIVMTYPSTKKSRGFGFVTFADLEDAERALRTSTHILDGKTVECRRFDYKGHSKPKRQKGARVFLGGLPQNIPKEDLKQFFSRYGEITDVVIPFNKKTRKPKAFGFIAFKDEEAAEKCRSERFVYLNGRRVLINKAAPRENSLSAEPSEGDDNIPSDSESLGSRDSDSLKDEDSQSAASGENLIEFEKHPEFQQLLRNYFLEKLIDSKEVAKKKVNSEKWQPPSNNLEELEIRLKHLLMNSDKNFIPISESQDVDRSSDTSSSDEDDYKNELYELAYSSPQGELDENILKFLGDKIAGKPILPEEKKSTSNILAYDCTDESPQKSSAPFTFRDQNARTLTCSLCQWTPPDGSCKSFLAHCKTRDHRTKLRDRFSTQKIETNNQVPKTCTNSQSPEETETKLGKPKAQRRTQNPTATEPCRKVSEEESKTKIATKSATEQQGFPDFVKGKTPLEVLQQRSGLRCVERLLDKEKERTEQVNKGKHQKPEEKKARENLKEQQEEQRVLDELPEVKTDRDPKPKDQKRKVEQENSQKKTQKQTANTNNLNIFILAKGMASIQPTSENELLCTVCNKIIPKTSDFEKLMKNVSLHLQSKKHLGKILQVEISPKNTSSEKQKQAPSCSESSKKGNETQKKTPADKCKVQNQGNPIGCKDSILEEPTKPAQKNFPKGKDIKSQTVASKSNRSAGEKKSNKKDVLTGKFLCLQCNVYSEDFAVFERHLRAILHSGTFMNPEFFRTNPDDAVVCNSCHRYLFGSLYEINIHCSECLNKKS